MERILSNQREKHEHKANMILIILLCALHHSVETPAHCNCTFCQKFKKCHFYFVKSCHGNAAVVVTIVAPNCLYLVAPKRAAK